MATVVSKEISHGRISLCGAYGSAGENGGYADEMQRATALLHAIGVLLTTKTLLPVPQATLLRWSGSAIAAVGVVSLGVQFG